jgi:hypothetical protein
MDLNPHAIVSVLHPVWALPAAGLALYVVPAVPETPALAALIWTDPDDVGHRGVIWQAELPDVDALHAAINSLSPLATLPLTIIAYSGFADLLMHDQGEAASRSESAVAECATTAADPHDDLDPSLV